MIDCPKCGSPASLTNNDEVEYFKGEIIISPGVVIDATSVSGPNEEWLVYTCHRCGYKHKEPCKDAEQANT